MNTVTLERKNLYNWQPNESKFGNDVHYHALCEWCARTFDNPEWTSSVNNDGSKTFTFTRAKHATMFRLMWTQ